MVRLANLPTEMKKYLENVTCPSFGGAPWVPGVALDRRRVCIVSTAGIHLKHDRPFDGVAGDYRAIPDDCLPGDLMMSHISDSFDRVGFQMDWNVVFPLERLRELADSGIIGSVARYHYSFMGATDPMDMEPAARSLATKLLKDGVDAVLLVPV